MGRCNGAAHAIEEIECISLMLYRDSTCSQLISSRVFDHDLYAASTQPLFGDAFDPYVPLFLSPLRTVGLFESVFDARLDDLIWFERLRVLFANLSDKGYHLMTILTKLCRFIGLPKIFDTDILFPSQLYTFKSSLES